MPLTEAIRLHRFHPLPTGVLAADVKYELRTVAIQIHETQTPQLRITNIPNTIAFG